MDIMIAADLNYFLLALTLIVSLFHNHMERDMNIYFLCSEFGEKEFAVLDKIESRRRDSGGFPNRIRLDVYTDNILSFCGRHISAGAFCLRKVVTGMLPEPAYPVIKGTWDNVVI